MTQSQYNVAKQSIRNRHIKIELLNFNWQTIDSLEGYCVGGSISYNASSDLRRSCSINMVVRDSTFDVRSGGEIFLNRYIKIYIGEEEFPTQNIVWYNKGVYLINSPTYKYSDTERTLSFDGLDLVSKLTGLRNGNLVDPVGQGAVTRKIYANSVVRDVIITILQEAGFNKYIVQSCPVNTPQDYEFDVGSTRWDILTALRDIYPMYQMYFDVDGVFHYEPIPFGENPTPIIDDNIWVDNVLSEQIMVDFENVKNVIEVHGVIHEPQYFQSGTVSGRTISVNLGSSQLANGYLIGFNVTTAISGSTRITLSIITNGTTISSYLINDGGEYITNIEANHIYIVTYRRNTNDFIFLGSLQPYAYLKDTNINSPFYVSGEAGEIPIALFGGEYDNIQTDYLAKQRAIYELYVRCRLNDTISLSCVPIWYLDVNQIASYTTHNNVSTNLYLIQSINMDLSQEGTMSINMSKYYSLYPN